MMYQINNDVDILILDKFYQGPPTHNKKIKYLVAAKDFIVIKSHFSELIYSELKAFTGGCYKLSLDLDGH